MHLKKCACIEPMYGELPFLDRFRAGKDDGFAFLEFWSGEDRTRRLSGPPPKRPASASPVSTATPLSL